MKRFMCLFLAAALLLATMVTAFAAGSMTPSATSKTRSVGSSSDSGWTRPAAPAAEVVVAEASKAVNDQIAAMNAAVASGKSVLSTLSGEIQAQLAELGNNVTVNEACAIKVKNYKQGDIDTEFSFATRYEEGMTLLSLITCFDANNEIMNQFVLPATVTADGNVVIHFTEAVLKAMSEAASSSNCIFEQV